MSYHVSNPHVVHKHALNPALNGSFIELELTLGHEVIAFGKQGNNFYIWEQHSMLETQKYKYSFWFTGTGSPIPGWVLIMKHIGTTSDEGYVWHLFEVSDQRNNMGPPEEYQVGRGGGGEYRKPE